MSAPAKASEPTMEEILASIRRIISDDQPQTAELRTPSQPDGLKPAVADAAKAPEPDDDVDAMFAAIDASVSRTAADVAPPAFSAKSSPAPMDEPNDLDVLELTEEMAEDEEPEPKSPEQREALAAPDAPKPPAAAAAPERLISAQTDDAVTKAFDSLANTILTNNARTLDDVVKDMLRPMLRAWLDDNLPPLVERLVRQEIERVARGGR